MTEYVIINKTAIQNRIEELEWSLNNIPESYITKHEAQIYALKQILSQSTPLIPEIEKAYQSGFDYYSELRWDIENGYGDKKTVRGLNKQDYISNLKLDI